MTQEERTPYPLLPPKGANFCGSLRVSVPSIFVVEVIIIIIVFVSAVIAIISAHNYPVVPSRCCDISGVIVIVVIVVFVVVINKKYLQCGS